MMQDKQVLGICGGIGSGKSILCRLVEHYGIPVFDTDSCAKNVYFDPVVSAQLERVLGRSIFDEKGDIDKPFLSSVIFGSSPLKKEVEQIVHSAVEDRFFSWKSQHLCKWVGIESGILFTSGMNRLCDKIILVDAPPKERAERVVRRNNIPLEEVEKRIRTQLAELETAKLQASYTIKNYAPYSVVEQWEEIFNTIII
ncbi:MAG: dephospho-CoA kinase [Porphyromonas sp.]|nr:dephospho-CoA kinase [Porphyromonas sp.]